MREIKVRKFIFSILILFLVGSRIGIAQTQIRGVVQNDNQETLFSANVLLKDSLGIEILAYTYTDNKGEFAMTTDAIGEHILFVSYFGYENKEIPLNLSDAQSEKQVNLTLQNSSFELGEVFIQADLQIRVTNDTINFKTKFFADGTEQTVEDLLKRIPGLQIDDNGVIKVGDQEIERLMIDGDDLFEKGYKLLSKNMPAYPIEEVEILNKYSNNPLLKGIEESDKVALNLKLSEDSKRIWFGNIKTSLGNDSYYQFKGNLMNFGKNTKFYFLTNLNNLGYDATGDIQHLIRPFRYNEPASIGDNQQVNGLLNLSSSTLGFNRNRTNFNNAKLLSFNAIFNPTENTKIKTLGFFNQDIIDFQRNTLDVVNTENTNFTNTEDYTIRNKKRITFGKLDITHTFSKTKRLESETKFNYGRFSDGSNLLFNDISTVESLEHQNRLFDQKLNYTNRFKNGKAILFTGRFINENTPKTYHVDKFLYSDLFPQTPEADNILQNSQNKMQFVGFNAHLLDRKENGDLLELQFGNEYRKDQLASEFSLLEGQSLLAQPEAYQNEINYQVNNLYFKSKYRYKLGDLGITGTLNFHQLFNNLENNTRSSHQNPFFIHPSIGLDWEINSSNKITSSYSYNTTNANVLDVYDNYFLTGYRSFTKGTGDFHQLNASNFFLNYRLGDWMDRLFINTTLLYLKNHDYLSTHTVLQQEYASYDKILVKDQEVLSIQSNADYYLESLSSSLRINMGYTKSEFENKINDSELRKVQAHDYTYGLEFRSMFNGIFNFHIGTKWTKNDIKTTLKNSFTDNSSFADLSFIFSKKFDAKIQSERYYFGNLKNKDTYYFLDFDVRYQLIESKLTLSLSGRNLLNTKTFSNISISDIGTSTTEYRLLPRIALLKMEYRF